MFRLVFIAVAVVGCFGFNDTDDDNFNDNKYTTDDQFPFNLEAEHFQAGLNDTDDDNVKFDGFQTYDRMPYNLEMELYNNKLAKYEHSCDAIVISSRAVLTAASCAYGSAPYAVRFRHGNIALGKEGTLHQAEKIFIHEKYHSGSSDYNIAVVVVTVPFPSRAKISLASSSPRAGLQATSIGWGILPGTFIRPTQRRENTYPIFDHAACVKQENPSSPITDRILCAGHLGENQLDCGGDLGAPLVVDDHLVGIVIARICGSDTNTMGIFTNVANLSSWISRLIHSDASDVLVE